MTGTRGEPVRTHRLRKQHLHQDPEVPTTGEPKLTLGQLPKEEQLQERLKQMIGDPLAVVAVPGQPELMLLQEVVAAEEAVASARVSKYDFFFLNFDN